MDAYLETDWSLMDFEKPKKSAPVTPIKGTCPKCGRKLGKGGHFHVKSCNGDPRQAD